MGNVCCARRDPKSPRSSECPTPVDKIPGVDDVADETAGAAKTVETTPLVTASEETSAARDGNDDFGAVRSVTFAADANDDDDSSGEEKGERSAPMTKCYTAVAQRAPSGSFDDEDEGDEEASADKQSSEKEPQSLREKVEMDFLNEALVSPQASFVVANATFQVFGGLRLGEKFTVDKSVVARTAIVSSQNELEETYTWSAASCLKGQTCIAALCQKGQKSASDPTPNQDNYFVLQIDGLGIYGVFDGHGPFGHLVSFRLVQSLPHFLVSNEHFQKDWSRALNEAFQSAQKELLEFCGVHNVNLEASGSAGSVLVCDGSDIHIAHIGDAGVMVGSYNRHDERLLFGTEDHKPGNPLERERLEAAGSEVRELGEDDSRIYMKGSTFPGLSMSRAFGDTACGGVIQEPEYHKMSLEPDSEYYAILASDGIWEFIKYDEAVKLTAKKLRLKRPLESATFITGASRKRWEYKCGEYCDDITCLLVQWNVNAKDAAGNFTMSVRRHE